MTQYEGIHALIGRGGSSPASRRRVRICLSDAFRWHSVCLAESQHDVIRPLTRVLPSCSMLLFLNILSNTNHDSLKSMFKDFDTCCRNDRVAVVGESRKSVAITAASGITSVRHICIRILLCVARRSEIVSRAKALSFARASRSQEPCAAPVSSGLHRWCLRWR